MSDFVTQRSQKIDLISDICRLTSALPPLLIEAERIAQAVHQGIHGRRRAGTGETFWQFRRYEQGDPAERIDWRQSSRTDKIFIREREWEAAQSAYLWTDMSGSMRYSSQKALPTKAERAQLIMLALASLLLRGGEKVTWMDQDSVTAFGKTGIEKIAQRLTADQPLSSHPRRRVSHLFSDPFKENGMPAFAGVTEEENRSKLQQSVPPEIKIARHAQIILASDFLMPLEIMHKKMRSYAALNLHGVLLHVLDPQEDNFNLQGRLEIQGCEGEDPLLLPNAASLRDAYHQRMAEHKQELALMAQSAGWHYTSHVTTELPHLALMRLYQFLDAKQS